MSRGGFTLIEVVVALLLAAVMTGALTRSLAMILREGASSSKHLAASWLARTALEETRMNPVDLDPGEQSGIVATADGPLRRTVTIGEEGDPRLVRVTVTVGSPPVVLETLLYRPWSVP